MLYNRINKLIYGQYIRPYNMAYYNNNGLIICPNNNNGLIIILLLGLIYILYII